MFEDLKGRTAVVFGVANKRSIAWAIAQGLHAAGANMAITYQNERMEQEAKDLILSLPGAEGFMCDVSNDAEIANLFEKLKQRYGKLHTLVHSVAFAPADELKGDFVNTTREGFRVAHDVSVYSLIAVCRAAAPLMEDGGSVITMTYYGAEKVVPHYNVMGVAKAALECTVRYLAQDLGRRKIRVNAISAGPSRLWPHAASPALATCCTPTPSALLCNATSRSVRSAAPAYFSPPMRVRGSRAKRSTWIAATTSWGSDAFTPNSWSQAANKRACSTRML